MMGWQPWTLGAIATLSAGCALIAGYDFGKYGETGGTGGSGTGASGGPSASSSSSGTTSSGMTTSGSSGSGMPDAGSELTLLDGLYSPYAIAIDPGYVYFTTYLPLGPSSAGWVTKDGSDHATVVSDVEQAPALVAGGGSAYFCGINYFPMQTSLIESFKPQGVPSVLGTLPSEAVYGVALHGSTVYFTSTTSGVWRIVTSMMPENIVPNQQAQGPIAADNGAVYWPSTSGQMMRANLDGTSPTMLGSVGGMVNGVTVDSANVYWTTDNGAVYQVDKASGGTPTALVNPDGTPSYGLAIDDSGSFLYFTNGDAVMRSSLASTASNVVVNGLSQPRGVAVDATYIYVALAGTAISSGQPADGSIVKIHR